MVETAQTAHTELYDVRLEQKLAQRAADASRGGPGHGYRAALIARHLAWHLIPQVTDLRLDELDAAARAHELGALIAPDASVGEQASAGAGQLRAEGATTVICLLVCGDDCMKLPPEVRGMRYALELADQLNMSVSQRIQAGAAVPLAVREGMLGIQPQLPAEVDRDALGQLLLLIFSLSNSRRAS